MKDHILSWVVFVAEPQNPGFCFNHTAFTLLSKPRSLDVATIRQLVPYPRAYFSPLVLLLCAPHTYLPFHVQVCHIRVSSINIIDREFGAIEATPVVPIYSTACRKVKRRTDVARSLTPQPRLTLAKLILLTSVSLAMFALNRTNKRRLFSMQIVAHVCMVIFTAC